MARPRAFDEQQALRRALDVFWVKGYNAASMNDLLEATDLSKSSLYASFGSKQALLIEAIACYGEQLMQGPLSPLTRANASRADIEEMLDRVITIAVTPEGQRGCFINNCFTEIAPHVPEVMAASAAVMRTIDSALSAAAERGQREGRITAAESPSALAAYLIHILTGINLAAKSVPGRERLDNIVRIALRSLD